MRVKRGLILPAVAAIALNALALAPILPAVASANTTHRLISSPGTTTLSGPRWAAGPSNSRRSVVSLPAT